jgi:hypothetical protein
VLTDVSAWPQWNRFVTAAEGRFAVGELVSLEVPKLSPALRTSLRLTVLEVDPLRRLRFGLSLARLGLPGLFSTEHTLTLSIEEDAVRL